MKNSLSNKLERILSRYAIPNITLYLIICYAFGYIIEFVNSDFIKFMTLEPGLILHGQIWRLVTWVVIPPATSNIFFVLIMLYFYYSIGNILERIWGTYRLNLYLFQGLIFTIIGSFVLYAIFSLMGMSNPTGFGMVFSTYYINMSLFLAYAATLPDMQVLLFFIIPIKVKALGIVYGVLLLFECLQGGLIKWVVVGSSLLNFVVFFLSSRSRLHRTPKQMKQKMEYTRQTQKAENSRVTKHKCAVCGRTGDDYPELEFRFCSKCNGNYEYCSDHLFTHEHVK